MIISKSHAEKLVRNGQGEVVTGVIVAGTHYIAIKNNKHDRFDHYEVTEGQFSAKSRFFNPDVYTNIKSDLKIKVETSKI